MTKWILGISLIAASPFVYAEEMKTETTTTTTQSSTAAQSPVETCKTMVQAATSDNYDKVVENTATYGGKAQVKKEEKRFEKMRGSYMSKLKDIKCGAEHMAGTRAMVEAETQGEKRFVPFIKEKNMWKFDARTYMSFYPPKHAPMGHHGGGMEHGKMKGKETG